MSALKNTFRGVCTVLAVAGFVGCSATVIPLADGGNDAGPCGGPCPTGDVCVNGACVSACVASGGLDCGQNCVHPLTDNANCGACAMACLSGQACSAGKCATTCANGYDACSSDAGFYCAILAGDFYNCGTCGKVCATGQYCSQSTCTMAPPSCPAGLSLCPPDAGTGSCVNFDSDNNNCGACNNPCSAGATCLAGTCQSGPACPNGLLACPVAGGGTTCVANLIDPNNCGVCGLSCGANGVCLQGACACPSLFTACGSMSAPYCAALPLDPANCGSCGHSCVTCENCNLGTCAAQSFLTAEGMPGDAGTDGYSSVVIGDFNGDGVNDLAVVQGVVVDVFFGSPTGYSDPIILPFSGSPYYGAALATGDFNGDKITDLALGYVDAMTTAAELVIFTGSPDAGFTASTVFPVAPSFAQVTGAATGDFNGDGLTDVAVLASAQGITVFYNNGAGGFTAYGGIPGLGGMYPTFMSLASGDTNGDGISDLVTTFGTYATSSYVYSIDVLLGGDAGIGTEPSSTLGISYGFAVAIGAGQIYGFQNGQLVTYLYSDAGLVTTGSVAVPGGSLYNNPVSAAAQDMNGDGQMDVIGAMGSSVLVWLGNDGGFDSPLSVVGGQGAGLAVGDLNGDNLPDVAATNGPYTAPGGAILINSCH